MWQEDHTRCRSGVAETGFSYRLTTYKIVGHFFGLSYLNISGNNQVKSSFFRISNISVPCPHAQLRRRTVIKKVWTFFGPLGRDRSQSPTCWFFLVKQIHQSMASERTTRLHSKQYRFFRRKPSVLLPCDPRRTLAGFSGGRMVIVLRVLLKNLYCLECRSGVLWGSSLWSSTTSTTRS